MISPHLFELTILFQYGDNGSIPTASDNRKFPFILRFPQQGDVIISDHYFKSFLFSLYKSTKCGQEGHFHNDNAMTIGLLPLHDLINIARKKIISSSFQKNFRLKNAV
jgi:hypothetical protein